MVNGFSSINIAVPDLAAAVAEYRCLFGTANTLSSNGSLVLRNVSVVLCEEPNTEAPCLAGLTLWCQAPISFPADRRGLALAQSANRSVTDQATGNGIRSVDHVVLRTSDADDCIRLFEKNLGLRLALDQSVPEWGGRMLFFRCGKLTLEVIQSQDPPDRDAFWGITYYCPDLAATLAALDAAGVAHSGERLGRKPGTRVATVKSHTLGIPTLLIGPSA